MADVALSRSPEAEVYRAPLQSCVTGFMNIPRPRLIAAWHNVTLQCSCVSSSVTADSVGRMESVDNLRRPCRASLAPSRLWPLSHPSFPSFPGFHRSSFPTLCSASPAIRRRENDLAASDAKFIVWLITSDDISRKRSSSLALCRSKADCAAKRRQTETRCSLSV